jgi:NhaP-type Na+/H+ or K+/H+ antiporter
LLGAILAPTDPVVASDVEVEHPFDSNPLRFSLTGEASWDDGTAFPFVMLGLGLLGADDMGWGEWRWAAVDVLWAGVAGVAIGALSGTCIGRLVVYLHAAHREALGVNEFGLSYGAALSATPTDCSRFLPPGSRCAASRQIARATERPNR